MGSTCSTLVDANDPEFTGDCGSTSKSPYAKVLRNGSADTAINSIPGDVLADPAVQQLAQAICRHNGRSAVRQLHDSAASEYCAYADQISNRVKFLTRRDTANINEALPVLPTAEPAPEQAEKAFAQMPPLQARKAFLLGAPKPACCPERSRTAEGINRLRQADDPDIESLLRLACRIFHCDMACCTLLTGDAYNVISGVGILRPGICPDRWGFCAWSFLNSNHELLIVEDTKNDVRFSENFFVKDPHYHLRFYAGCPLVAADGHRLGTLCIVGHEPVSFDATRGLVLTNVAELLVRQLEQKWAESEARQSNVQLMRSLACYNEAFMFLDTSREGDWRVLHVNKAAATLLECDWSPVCLAYLAGARQDQKSPPFDGVPLTSLLDLQSGCMSSDVAKSHTSPSVMGASGGGAANQPFQLHMRRATIDSITPEVLQVGSPAPLQEKPSFGKHYYIAALVPLVSEPPQDLETPTPQLIPTSVGPRYAKPGKHFACLPSTGPFDGLLLGVLLGKGSFGRVYRGLWKGQLVGVKVVKDIHRLKLDPCGQPMEAVLTRHLKHQSIMRTLTHAWFVATDRGGLGGEQQCWLILEYCDKGSIVDAVMQGWFRTNRSPMSGQPDLRTVAMTGLEIASAVMFLHSKNIVHGDLSGGNVMLTSCSINPHGFQAKVGDFGLSRESDAPARIAGNLYGTITHMAPEVMMEAQIGPAADVYAFGVLLWEMLTSSRAWDGLRHAHIMCMVGVQKQMLAIPEGLHPTLGLLVSNCLARNPADRPSFKSIADTLSHFVQVTRGTEPADLMTHDDSSSTCSCDGGASCCTECHHGPGCAKASCLRCKQPTTSVSLHLSQANGTASMPDAEGVSSPESPNEAFSSMSHVHEAIALAKADQAKPAHSPPQDGKGVKRTSATL